MQKVDLACFPAVMKSRCDGTACYGGHSLDGKMNRTVARRCPKGPTVLSRTTHVCKQIVSPLHITFGILGSFGPSYNCSCPFDFMIFYIWHYFLGFVFHFETKFLFRLFGTCALDALARRRGVFTYSTYMRL